MNNDNWLDDIRNKMTDFELDEPSGLWERIETHRADRQQITPINRNGHRRGAVLSWLVAATLLTAIMLSGLHFFKPESKVDMTAARLAKDVSDNTLISPVNSEQNLAQTLPQSIGNRISRANALTAAVCQASQSSSAAQLTDDEPANQNPAGKDNENAENSETSPSADNACNRINTEYAESTVSASDSHNVRERVSVGIFTSGSIGNGMSGPSNNSGNKSLSGLMSDPTKNPDDGPVVQSQAPESGSSNTRNSRMQHHQPIRVGLTVAYPISTRLSLESGLTYSRLRSDVDATEANISFSGEQTLHYIGIPLNLKCRLASVRQFKFYASAGILAEKCVAGKLSGHKFINEQAGAEENTDIHEKKLQWSLNAAAGAQLSITPDLGIFIEPGISYYPDNGSDISSIYKDRPLNFNLNLGLRLTLGK